MTQTLSGDRLLARAFAASLALHIVLLALIPPLVANDGSQPVETLSFVRVVRLSVTTPTPHPLRAAVAKAPVTARVLDTGTARTAPSPRRPAHIRPVRRAAAIEHARVVAAVAHGNGTAAVIAPPSASVQTPVPSPPPQSAPQRSQLGGMLPLGMDEPTPVLEPSVRKALAALGVHVTLTVTVDENGRTKSVAFAPPLDAAIEAQIRSLLASASWDPAVCGGGMACEANAVLKL